MAINGTNDDDLLGGTFLDDVINGLDGDDNIFGSGGNDVLSGNDGNDFLKGGEGTDLIFGGAGADILISGELNATRDDHGRLRFGGNDTLSGGSGNDQLIVSTDSHNVQISGGSGVDVLMIGNGDFTAFLNEIHDDEPFNPEKAARIDLAAGTGHYELEVLSIFASDGRLSIIDIDLDISGVENVFGSAFSEFISGDAGANVIRGEGGNDTLQGRGGADTLDGGSGRDRAIYDTSFAVDIDLNRKTQIGGEAQGDRLISIEDIDGSRAADVIRGNSASNELFGNLGNDTLEGRGGADILNGGGDRDRAVYNNSEAIDIDLTRFTQLGGEAQGDVLISIEDIGGTLFADVIRGNSASNELSGGFENDTLEGRDGDDTLLGGFGNDILDGGDGDDLLDGERGNDTVILTNSPGLGYTVELGRDGADGDASNFVDHDILRSIENVTGTVFSDSINGNEQDNVLDGGALTDTLRGNDGNDTLIGGDGNDTLEGGDGNDTLVGGDGNDTLGGGANNDILDGGDGDDRISGGSGIDTVTLAKSGAPLILFAPSVVILGQNGVDGSVVNVRETDTLNSIENVIGSVWDDSITGNEQANRLDGGDGDDTLDGQGGDDVLNGGSGRDTLLGGEKNDVLNGGDGDDTLDGQGGVDTVTLVKSAASVVTLGQKGADGSVVNVHETDTLRSIENVIGSIFTDTITGNEQANALDGGSGNDTLDGRNGDDTLVGNVGDDNYLFSGSNFGNDLIQDLNGFDTAKFDFSTIESITRVGKDLVVNLTSGTFTVDSHFAGFAVENAQDVFTNRVVTLAVGLTGGDASGIIAGTGKGETLDGRGGDDLLYGNGGKDTLLGGDGDDLLDGGKGKDVLVGGSGADTLVGGKGDDTFVFACNSGNDVIRDFGSGRDRIDFTAFDTTFRALDDNRDGRLERGEGDGHITVDICHGDTLLTFAGGSIRIDGVTGLGQHDFFL